MNKKSDRPILVYRFSSLGDIAMTVPVLRSFFNSYPNQKIVFVSRPYVSALFKEFDNLEFIPVDLHNNYKGLRGLFSLFSKLYGKRVRAVVDLHGVLRTKILNLLFRLTFTKVKSIDKGRAERKKLIRKKNKIFKPLTQVHYKYSDVFRGIGFPVDLSNHEYPIKPFLNQTSTEQEILSKNPNKKIIGIAPFAAHQGKNYPLDLMQKVIAYLQKDYIIYLFGGGNDNLKQLSIWENVYDNVIDLSNKLNLEQQINIINYIDLMISMDSANGHLAANYNIPVLTLWGMTHPFCGFTPFDQSQENSITIDRNLFPYIPTSIFGNKIPKGYENAFRTIDPKIVIEKALDILSTTTLRQS
tara:strand:- start:565 stop:1632 length:1068 start_codon:yes stop_codon:yes gene_type:complete